MGPHPGSHPDALHGGDHALHHPDVVPVPNRACVHPMIRGVILHPQMGRCPAGLLRGYPYRGPEDAHIGVFVGRGS